MDEQQHPQREEPSPSLPKEDTPSVAHAKRRWRIVMILHYFMAANLLVPGYFLLAINGVADAGLLGIVYAVVIVVVIAGFIMHVRLLTLQHRFQLYTLKLAQRIPPFVSAAVIIGYGLVLLRDYVSTDKFQYLLSLLYLIFIIGPMVPYFVLALVAGSQLNDMEDDDFLAIGMTQNQQERDGGRPSGHAVDDAEVRN